MIAIAIIAYTMLATFGGIVLYFAIREIANIFRTK